MSKSGVYDANSKKEVQYDGYDKLVEEALSLSYDSDYGHNLSSEEQMVELKLKNEMSTVAGKRGNKEYSTLNTLGYDDNKIPQNEKELQAMAQRMKAENDKINEPIAVDTRNLWDKVTGKKKSVETDGIVDQRNAKKENEKKIGAISHMLDSGKITQEEAEKLAAGEEGVNEQAEADIAAMVDAMMDSGNYPYLVRGADLKCIHGTHSRKLNLPKDHAVYITGEPLIHELDCVAGDQWNITTFGICNSPLADKFKPQPKVMLVVTDENGETKNVKGKVCIPQLVGTWQNVFDEVRIVDNGQKDPSDKLKDVNDKNTGYPTVTTDSFLVCKCQGIIEPLSSGQKETSSSGN